MTPDQASKATHWRTPVLITVLVCLVATLLAFGLPDQYAATGVGLWFLAATYWLCIRDQSDAVVQHFGLSLGGLVETTPISGQRLIRAALGALAWALGCALILFPLFWLGWLTWFTPNQAFSLRFQENFPEEILGQLLLIALPEEAFFRGYLQTRLDAALRPRLSLLGAKVGPGLVLASALFALGHLATDPRLDRLAVFFPALLFGWLRARTGGIGASLAFHALCNLFAAQLARGYSLIP